MDRSPLLRMALVPVVRPTTRSSGHFITPCWTAGHSHLFFGKYSFITKLFEAGTKLRLDLPRPYRDYIGWLQKQDFSKAEGFWRHTLEGFTEPTPLVVDHMPSKDRNVEIGGAIRKFGYRQRSHLRFVRSPSGIN